MKTKILLALAILCSSLTFAQVKTSLGIRGGVTSSSMKGEAVENLQNMLDFANGNITTNSRTGFYAGTFINLPVSDMISIEPAVYYSQKGYELRGELNIKGMDFVGANARATLQSQYIDVPVVLKANVKGLQLFAGPQMSYLVQADLRTRAGVFGFNVFNRKMDATDEFNRWDAAITGGIGYELTKGLNITASYDHGLSRVDKNKNVNSYNRSIKAGLAYNF